MNEIDDVGTSVKQHWPWYAGALAALILLWFLTPILAPFVIGAGIAYLGDPTADRLERVGLSRTASVAIVFSGIVIVMLLLLILLAPMLYEQSVALIHNIPAWVNWILDNGLPKLGIHLPAGTHLDAEGLQQIVSEHWSQAGGVVKTLWLQVSESGKAFATMVANLLMIPIVSFYLMRDWDRLVAWIASLIPPRALPRSQRFAREADEVLGSFIRGQLLVMAALAAIYSIGLTLTGLKLGLIIGVIAGLLSFVPYLGFVVGFGSALIAMLVQTHEWLPLLWICLVFGIGQIMESAVLTPILVGDKIGMHPVAVIFAVMAGGQLFGFIGVLVALPVSAVIAVALRHAKDQWLRSALYRGGAAPHEEPAAPNGEEPPTAT
ncbi:AI-2E family transporter [Solimonas terrae]|uniref:AI-2E family transporter n=1 Tax=Solimonas terrae TaxID=1396819 RepID=A0A6M2BPY7_9GAMM|nr:AI-2E family transporter [Solimonas terrae]NGY04672.1 AI-2E family transporter [Solimonas terrae]